jgi:hypothetical protein
MTAIERLLVSCGEGDDLAESGLVERVGEHGARRFGGIAVAPSGARQNASRPRRTT